MSDGSSRINIKQTHKRPSHESKKTVDGQTVSERERERTEIFLSMGFVLAIIGSLAC